MTSLQSGTLPLEFPMKVTAELGKYIAPPYVLAESPVRLTVLPVVAFWLV
jgi:hypothetical protein